jgi:endonuclease/exonuclease/phosphatase family metal-dependent hydrolase
MFIKKALTKFEVYLTFEGYLLNKYCRNQVRNMNYNIKTKTITIVTSLFLLINTYWITNSFSKNSIATNSSLDSRQNNRITLMTYNLENLFDTIDDPGKDDEAYLPLKIKKQSSNIQKKCQSLDPKWRSECKNLDWNEKNLNSKMYRISDVILKSHNGVGPDIIIFQEVENINVLEKLRLKYLKKYYPNTAILIEGPDRRGVDVGILSKLSLKDSPKLHLLKFHETIHLKKKKFPITRGILEANFILPDQTPISIFGVHFPSQGSVTETRKQALEQLVMLMKEKPKNSLVVAGGDFNVTSAEEKQHEYFHKLKSDFLVSHIVGCKMCKGTNYFHPKRSWSFLDIFLFSNNFKESNDKNKLVSTWALDPNSIRVYNQNLYQNNKWGSPMKFELGRHQQGVSDHWPLLADIFLNSSRSKGTFK